MKILQKTEPMIDSDNLYQDYFTAQSIFFDIETTGFSAKNTITYLIGAAYRKEDKIVIHQFFAEKKDDEKKVILAFFDLLNGFQTLITFNGQGFDIPYLKSRCGLLHIKENFDAFKSLDLYKSVSKVSHIMHLPNKKQKSIEAFLSIERADLFHGGELIEVYYDYLRTQSSELEAFLLLHNFEDVLGMTKLLPILSYPELFHGMPQFLSVEVTSDRELILTLKAKYAFPKQISCRGKSCYLTCYKDTVKIMIKTYQGELLFFYPNYKDYYYLPLENTAIHKSLAEFVDKSHRQKAKACNCYTRRQGEFLPQFSPEITPCFLPEYKSKDNYFELTDDFLNDSDCLSSYAAHLLFSFYNKSALVNLPSRKSI